MRNWMEKLRKDSLWMGILLATLVPAITFGIIYGVLALIIWATGKEVGVLELVSAQKIILLSIIPNIFIMRHYLLKLKYDYTGRGILLVTFIIAIIFVVMEFTMGS